MNIKRLLTHVLLIFVAVSLGFLVYRESIYKHPAAPKSADPPAANAADAKVVAYYFHGTNRCVTCRTIEKYSREAIESGFGKELQAGTLKFMPVNVEEPGNRHFIQDYQLVTKSLVLVEMEQGQPKQWKNLDQIWTLVRDQPAFIKYVQEEVRGFLKG